MLLAAVTSSCQQLDSAIILSRHHSWGKIMQSKSKKGEGVINKSAMKLRGQSIASALAYMSARDSGSLLLP